MKHYLIQWFSIHEPAWELRVGFPNDEAAIHHAVVLSVSPAVAATNASLFVWDLSFANPKLIATIQAGRVVDPEAREVREAS